MSSRANKRKITILVNAQTLWQIRRRAAASGYREDELGKVVDDLTREWAMREKGAGKI